MRAELRRTRQSFRRILQTGAATIRLLRSEMDSFAFRGFGLAVLLVLTGSLFAVASPVIFKLVLDDLPAGRADTLASGLLALVLAYVSSQWLARSFSELRWLLYGRAEQRLIRRLSGRVFAHLLTLPLRFHLDRKTGALSRALANGILGCRVILEHGVFSLLPAIVQLAAIAAVLGQLYHPAFLLILGLAVFAYLIVFGIGAARISESIRSASAAEIEASGLMTDGLLNFETIKCFTAERRAEARFDEALRRGEAHWTRVYRRRTVLGLLVVTIFALSLASVLVVASHEITRGAMTIGDFVLVNAYILQIVTPLEMLGLAFRDAAQGVAFIERLLELMAHPPEESSGRQVLPQDGRGELVFEHVSFSYRPGQPIIRDVSFRISAGRTVAIVGTSGSGKSTLVRLLVRLLDPDEGRILLDGVPIAELSATSVRQAIAVVPQDTVLFNDTIAENIAVGGTASTPEEIARAARLAQIHHLVDGPSHDHRPSAGERGLKLSGGERQRVAIARAVLGKPRIFVFDEATSSLDSRTEREIIDCRATISGQATTLVIAHRLSAVIDADEILVLEAGKLVEHGSHASLLARKGVYCALWDAQQRASGTAETARPSTAGTHSGAPS